MGCFLTPIKLVYGTFYETPSISLVVGACVCQLFNPVYLSVSQHVAFSPKHRRGL